MDKSAEQTSVAGYDLEDVDALSKGQEAGAALRQQAEVEVDVVQFAPFTDKNRGLDRQKKQRPQFQRTITQRKALRRTGRMISIRK